MSSGMTLCLWFPTFRRNVVPWSLRIKASKKSEVLLGPLESKTSSRGRKCFGHSCLSDRKVFSLSTSTELATHDSSTISFLITCFFCTTFVQCSSCGTCRPWYEALFFHVF